MPDLHGAGRAFLYPQDEAMAQDKEFVGWIVDTLYPLNVRSRAMFGAYMLYCDEKPVAIVGGEQLYIKRSDADSALFVDTELAPPYEGANDYHLVPEDLLRETEWMRHAIQATADALPRPKPKQSRKKKATD
jgi:TfoX/Sxy family transcriptional regulator of competence genes